MNKIFYDILNDIESLLLNYYNLRNSHRISQYIVSTPELKNLGNEFTDTPKRAFTVLQENSSPQKNSDIFLGVFFDSQLQNTLEKALLKKNFDLNFVDILCVTIEETSHFHFLVDRISKEMPVTQLEIETQGEIDRFIILCLFLSKFLGSSNPQQIIYMLFDLAKFAVSPQEKEVYQKASNTAELFLRKMAHKYGQNILKEEARKNFKDVYFSSWDEKLNRMKAA